MSEYYNPKRTKNLFNPNSEKYFKLSRSKIDLFLECPKCFYLDRRLGVTRPPGFPFALNNAVDVLLKKEFDIHRSKKSKHPLMKSYGIDAVPFQDKKLDRWRDNFHGVQFLHEATNLLIFGAVDDIWINPRGELIVVDYKSTSKSEKITELNKDWQIGYKRQMEIYQWLLRKNEFRVSNRGYFVYCNGNTDNKAFDGKLEFEVTLVKYDGDDSWIENAVVEAHKTLIAEIIPEAHPDCDYCAYRDVASEIENKNKNTPA